MAASVRIELCLGLLALIILANGAPILATYALGNRWRHPLDGGRSLPDGQRVFGHSKTVRGVVLGALAPVPGAWLIGLPILAGLIVGVAAMAGDLVSSFAKRRLRLEPSSRMTGLDQIPESLLPLLACRSLLALSWLEIALTSLAFLIVEILLSRLLYRLGIRDRPY